MLWQSSLETNTNGWSCASPPMLAQTPVWRSTRLTSPWTTELLNVDFEFH